MQFSEHLQNIHAGSIPQGRLASDRAATT
jgi:hypothetical protein